VANLDPNAVVVGSHIRHLAIYFVNCTLSRVVDALPASSELYSSASFRMMLPCGTESNLAAKPARTNSVECTELQNRRPIFESREVEKDHR
jgi:hypothetical protein